MDFRTFYRALTPEQRSDFAARVHTTTGYCHQITCGKRIELGLADAIVAVAPAFGAAVSLEELPLTDRARAQHRVRSGVDGGGAGGHGPGVSGETPETD